MTNHQNYEKALQVAKLALGFSRVERATRHEDGIRQETDADHTVMLGLVCLELCPPWLLSERVAAYVMVHDLPEVYAGDTQTLNATKAALADKKAREEAARLRLVQELGQDSVIMTLLAEYEKQESPEARYVRLMDKVLPKLTHTMNNCVVAKGLLADLAEFERAHEKQYRELSEKYPEFSDILELLRVSMDEAQRTWALSSPSAVSSPLREGTPVLVFDAGMRDAGYEHPLAATVLFVNGDQVDVCTSEDQIDCFPLEWCWVRASEQQP